MEHTLKEKLKYVKMHIEENVPIWEISRKYEYRVENLKYFCNLYRMWGEEPFLKDDKSRFCYTREAKLKAIKDVLSNEISMRNEALKLKLTDQSIIKDWIDKYKKYGESSIKDTYSREAYKRHDDKLLEKEYKKLLEDLERTKAENEYLKKSFPQVLKRSKQSKRK
jgi:transposase-like protein